MVLELSNNLHASFTRYKNEVGYDSSSMRSLANSIELTEIQFNTVWGALSGAERNHWGKRFQLGYASVEADESKRIAAALQAIPSCNISSKAA